jgi:hypothetical protein
VFEVIEQKVGAPRHFKEGFLWGETAGIDGGVETAAAALSKAVAQKPGLSERLAARKGHAASGTFEKDPVPLELINQLADRKVLTGELTSIGWADFNARPTFGAGATIPELPRRHRSVLLHRTDLRTRTAAQATVCTDYQNRSLVDALRVVTPAAGEGAALEKDRGPDARSIVHRTPLDVEDPPGASRWFYGNCVRRHIPQLIR